jgi:hypothetical protein
MTGRIEPALARQLAGDPGTSLEVIVTAAGGLDTLLAALPPEVTVDHVYRLIAGAAIHGPAGALARLARSPAVQTMEPVRTVRSQAPP